MVRQIGMTIELSEDERQFLIEALEHYHAFLHASHRADGDARELMKRLGAEKSLRAADQSSHRKEVKGKRA